MRSALARLFRSPRFWSIILIAAGLVLALVYGGRTIRSYREFQYAAEQGLLDGSASVKAIQPWMTVRYIAVAYAVPEEYIFAALEVPFDGRNRNEPLGKLNREFGFGRPEAGQPPTIVEAAGDAILAYRENPVITGLRDIRSWMSIQYIANSTGVPADYLFGQIGVPATENAYKPLDLLSREWKLGDPRRLSETIRDAVAAYEANP